MAPILAVPVLNRPDLLARCLASIDIDVRLLVIDNSGAGLAHRYLPDDAWLLEPPNNLGVAASWNLAIKCYPTEPFWLISNADTEFAPNDLARLVASEGYGWTGLAGDWRAFKLTASTVERVGFFDENYVPIYCEDADYEYRCTLAGVRWGFIQGDTKHAGSVCLDDHRRDNDRTYPDNVEYFRRKWAMSVRGPVGRSTPFGRGGSVADGTQPSLSRLRANTWRRPNGGA